ncbi:MAG: peptide chain release factor N(5)-glutamine methyltransferase [Dehalococcoidia bacterium]|nr:MAG: peptide chain release factor N(5)-glutamine methyltransferase [Dehalococcoidia bacterium]
MKIGESLGLIRERFSSAGIEEAPLEAELLMRHVLKLDAVAFLNNLGRELPSEQERLIDSLAACRLSGKPLAYITGKREFYGLEFVINPSVLIPRPETEHLVEKTLEIASRMRSPAIADIGTGSGAIAISLALNLPQAWIYATDISPEALELARLNARQHKVESRITFLLGDLTAPLPEPVDMLIANLPYVKSLDCATSPEPHLALDGGVEGLDVIERLCGSLHGKLKAGGWVLLEIGQGQEERVKRLLSAALPFAQIGTIKDLAGIERVVWGRIDDIII